MADKQHKVISHHSGGYQSKVKVSAGLVPSEASPLGLHMAIFSLCPHVAFLLCVSVSLISSSYKDTSHTGSGPISMICDYLNYSFKTLQI